MSSSPDAPPLQSQPLNLVAALFSFQGRLRRQHFFICCIFLTAGSIASNLHPIASVILYFPLIWCSFAATTKRLHDMDYSGWLNLIPFAVVAVGTVASKLLAGIIGTGLSVLLFVGSLWAFIIGWHIWLLASEGTSGANTYGPDPKLPQPIST